MTIHCVCFVLDWPKCLQLKRNFSVPVTEKFKRCGFAPNTVKLLCVCFVHSPRPQNRHGLTSLEIYNSPFTEQMVYLSVLNLGCLRDITIPILLISNCFQIFNWKIIHYNQDTL